MKYGNVGLITKSDKILKMPDYSTLWLTLFLLGANFVVG